MIFIDTLLSEYKWSLDYVLWDLPIVQAFALYAAICARYEITPKGPTYAEQELIKECFPATSHRRKQKRKHKCHSRVSGNPVRKYEP